MHLRFLLIFNGKFGGVGRLIVRQICSLRSYQIREISNKLCLTIHKDIEQSVLFQFRACYSKCGPRVLAFPGSFLEGGFWSLAQHIVPQDRSNFSTISGISWIEICLHRHRAPVRMGNRIREQFLSFSNRFSLVRLDAY